MCLSEGQLIFYFAAVVLLQAAAGVAGLLLLAPLFRRALGGVGGEGAKESA